MNDYLILILGFIFLFGGGHFLIQSSVLIAKRFNISDMVIGITIVALGTSAPELFVSLKAIFAGSADISISNVVGSNIANIALVLGLVAIIFPIKVKKKGVWIDWAVMMFASLLLYLFSWNNSELNIWEGITFLVLLIAYMLWLIYDTRSNKEEDGKNEVSSEDTTTKQNPLILVTGIFVASVVGLYYGSGWLVDGARNIAVSFGISERVVGITVIAFGTSVPELVTSLIAAFKKNTDISIGNIIGSNIFNIFAILGVTASVKKLNVNVAFLEKDYLWMMAIALLLFLMLLPLKKGIISRLKGVLLVAVYVVYIYFLF